MTATVYVVDDEVSIRELLVQALEAEGYAVEAFSDGRDLLDAAREDPPDLVLLDIRMPEIDGWTVREELHDMDATRKVPVIAVTARGGESIERSAREGLGFDAYLRKPFDLDDLHGLVAAALEDA